jgi:transcriptional regulator with XRE-family HTH domain
MPPWPFLAIEIIYGNIAIEMSIGQTSRARPVAQSAAVLTRATIRAGRFLGIAQGELAAIIGVSAATLSRLANGQKVLDPGSKPWQLAALFVRLFRSLDAIVGSDDDAARAWLRGENTVLGGVPLDLIADPAGLVRTVDYLDAARARI